MQIWQKLKGDLALLSQNKLEMAEVALADF
jgi:hypothetical protein